MTITLLILLSAGLLVMGYLLCMLHSRLRLLERMDATRKREARDLSRRQAEVEHYFSFVREQQYKILEVLGKGEYQSPTAKPATLERVPRPLRTKSVMKPQPTTDK